MARKIPARPRIIRCSSMDKTVDQGLDYVRRATRREAAVNKQKNRQEKLAAKAAQVPAATLTKRIKKQASKAPRKSASRAPVSAPLVPASTSAPVRTSSKNLSRSASKNVIIEQQLQDRLDKHKANIGKLNFSLRWWDPNDLDLHVTCPCGTEISFMNKKCNKCGGQLDIDMNVGLNMSLEPVQHVFFNNPRKGLYKFFVKYYYGPKQFSGVKGKEQSKFALSLHEGVNQIFRYEDNVSNKQTEMHYDYNA